MIVHAQRRGCATMHRPRTHWMPMIHSGTIGACRFNVCQIAADAAAIPRLVLQGTDNLGVLSDFMISVSGGMLKAQKLTPGTWPL